MFDEGEKELTIFIPAASDGIGEEARRDGVFQSRQRRRGKKAGKKGGREEDESGWELRRAGGREKGGLGGRLKERGRKAKAYPAVLHATANSRSDCNVRRFVDFDGARIRRCEAADVSLARDRRDLLTIPLLLTQRASRYYYSFI